MFDLKKQNFLLSIVCCHHRAWATDVIREFWVPEIRGKFDYKFFYGRGSHELKPDEIVLDCDDAYRGLACKTQAICQWALEHGYDGVFKVDDDTVWIADRLYKAVTKDWADLDYVGRVNGATDMYHTSTYARGGTGYYLSRKVMEHLASQPTPNPDVPKDYAEDSWVGRNTEEGGFVAVNDDRLRCADFSGPNRGPRPANSVSWKADCPTSHNNFITVCEFLGEGEQRPVYDLWTQSREKFNTLVGKLKV